MNMKTSHETSPLRRPLPPTAPPRTLLGCDDRALRHRYGLSHGGCAVYHMDLLSDDNDSDNGDVPVFTSGLSTSPAKPPMPAALTAVASLAGATGPTERVDRADGR